VIEPSHAVFLSYASQDALAAQKICEALRAVGIEVFLDQSALRADGGDSNAYQYATIYAQWGDRAKALEWLEVAWRLQDPGLEELKIDPLMDPLRQEARFQAIEKALKFPN
jgi:TIR domain